MSSPLDELLDYDTRWGILDPRMKEWTHQIYKFLEPKGIPRSLSNPRYISLWEDIIIAAAEHLNED